MLVGLAMAEVLDGGPTKDELLGRGKHVQGKGDLILVVLLLQPFDQAGGLEQEVCAGDEYETCAEGVGSRRVGEKVHGRVRSRRAPWGFANGDVLVVRRLNGLVES